MRATWLCFTSVIVAAAACDAGGGGGKTGATGAGAGMSAGAGMGGAGAGDVGLTTGSGGDPGPASGADGVVTPTCQKSCTDFPATPILDTVAIPANVATLFGPASNFDPGLCVAEPALGAGNQPGALVPANWLRMRFRIKPAAGEDLFEIRLKAPSQVNELVAYTESLTWAIPHDIWAAMGVKGNAIDQPITVTIRGIKKASPGKPTGAQGTFTIAPVTAGGSMVYWAATSSDVAPTTSKLVGFYVGNETIIDALKITDVQQSGILAEGGRDLRGMYSDPKGVPPGHVECIGCHVSTPDGSAVGFTDHWPWDDVISSIEKGSAGATPSWFTEGGQRLLNQPWLGMITFSQAHWTANDRIAITSYSTRDVGVGFTDAVGTGNDRLAWVAVDTTVQIPWMSGQNGPTNDAVKAAQGTAWGFLDLIGETQAASTPSWSHDGKTILYTSSSKTQDGRLGDDAETDIHLVPYNDRKGGAVTPLQGAATPGVSEYYPSFSADDKLVAYNRASSTAGKIYYRPDGEVYVLPIGGGVPTRLAANDPPACTGEKSPGIINSWAKWSPTVVQDSSGRTYYWMIFSSARDYPGAFVVPKNQYSPQDTRASQLYMAAVVADKQGNLTTYPAVYLWNQEPTTSNLTPSWDNFQIPEPPPPK